MSLIRTNPASACCNPFTSARRWSADDARPFADGPAPPTGPTLVLVRRSCFEAFDVRSSPLSGSRGHAGNAHLKVHPALGWFALGSGTPGCIAHRVHYPAGQPDALRADAGSCSGHPVVPPASVPPAGVWVWFSACFFKSPWDLVDLVGNEVLELNPEKVDSAKE